MNKELFLRVLNNKVIGQLVFKSVKLIHKWISHDLTRLKWSQVLNIPETLASYGYFDLLRLYFQKNIIDVSQLNSFTNILGYIVSMGSKETLDFMIKLILDCNTPKKQQSKSRLIENAISAASRSNRFDMIQNIESIIRDRNEPIEISYTDAFLLSPLSNNMDILKYIARKILDYNIEIDLNFKRIIINSTIANAALMCRLDMIEWLDSTYPDNVDYDDYNSYRMIIESGNNDILEHFLARSKSKLSLLDLAAEYNRLELFQKLHEYGSKCTTIAMNMAARNGNIEMLEWLHMNRTEGCTDIAMNSAAHLGYFEVVKWLHANRTEHQTHRAMDFAALSSTEMVKWFHSNRTEGCSNKAMDNAVCTNNLELVQWLHANRTEGCTVYAMDSACGKGNLLMVKWLHENRTEGCTDYAMDQAIANEKYDVLDWLHSNRTEGCSRDAIEITIINRNLEMIQWLLLNRKETEDMCSKSNMLEWITERNNEIMQLLIANSQTFMDMFKVIFRELIGNNNINLVKQIYSDKYVSALDIVNESIANVDLLRWILSENRDDQLNLNQLKQILNNIDKHRFPDSTKIIKDYIEKYN